jgi:Bacterial Ig-like domain (group 3)
MSGRKGGLVATAAVAAMTAAASLVFASTGAATVAPRAIVVASAAPTLATTTTFAIVPATVVAFQPSTLTATVTPSSMGAHPPTGTVQFSEGGFTIGAPELDTNGQAAIVAEAPAGQYTLTATYNGDDLYITSAGTATQTVTKASSLTEITSLANPATVDIEIIWVVDVFAQAPSDGVPLGAITFVLDGHPQGPFFLDDTGELVVGVSNLDEGAHTVGVQYSGDNNYLPSNTSMTQTVFAPPPPPAAGTPAPVASPPVATPVIAPAPTVKPLTSAGLLTSLRVPTTLRASAGGTVSVGTASNPPVRSVTVELARAGATHRLVGAWAAATRPLLGSVKVTVSSGQRRTVKVHLTRAARAALRRSKRMRVAVRVKAVDRLGRSVKATATRTLALRR